MGNTIIVKYNRRSTVKDRSGDFDSVEIGGEVSLDLEETDDPFAMYEASYERLAEQVETKLSEFSATNVRPSNGTASVTENPEEDQAADESPVRMDAPIERKTGQGWIEQQIKDNSAAIHEKMEVIPGEKIQPRGGNNTIDEYGTPSTAVIVPNEKVAFMHCRVFESVIKPANNGNPFAKVRIGKRGEDGIPGQYTNAQSFDAAVIKMVGANVDGEYVYKIREGDYVDVWGYFKPWKNDASKFSLELQKIQISEDG